MRCKPVLFNDLVKIKRPPDIRRQMIYLVNNERVHWECLTPQAWWGYIPTRCSYCLISQAKNATSSIFPCLRCNSHSESRTIQVNNKIVKQITTKPNNRYFCGIPRLQCWFSTSKRLLLWCSCIGEPHFDYYQVGLFSVCLPLNTWDTQSQAPAAILA